MKRLILATLAGLTVFALTAGLTASLGVSGGDLGAGTVDVSACDADGVTVSYSLLDANAVDGVTVSGIDATCNGQQLYVEVVGNTTEAVSGAVGSTGTETLMLTTTLDPELVTAVNVTIAQE